MEPFIVGVDITDVNKLYGRKRQIDILTSCAKRKGNAGIIGARRFGKTCLLKSLENYLRFSDESCAYPVYFDVKTQTGIKKTPLLFIDPWQPCWHQKCVMTGCYKKVISRYRVDALWMFQMTNWTCSYK